MAKPETLRDSVLKYYEPRDPLESDLCEGIAAALKAKDPLRARRLAEALMIVRDKLPSVPPVANAAERKAPANALALEGLGKLDLSLDATTPAPPRAATGRRRKATTGKTAGRYMAMKCATGIVRDDRGEIISADTVGELLTKMHTSGAATAKARRDGER